MTRVVLDSSTLEKLKTSEPSLEVCNTEGKVVGYFHPAVRYGKWVNGKIVSPFSDAEIEMRRQDRSGRPLKEIMEELQKL